MKCTIQDISRETGISRNTVAKVLSGKAGVALKTQELVLEKAKEMNFKSAIIDNQIQDKSGNIVFLTKASVTYSEYWVSVLKGINRAFSNTNYQVVLGIIEDIHSDDLELPWLSDKSTKGVILVEICNSVLIEKICAFGIPTVSVDVARDFRQLDAKLDIVIMENSVCVEKLVHLLYKNGKREFAFVGDVMSDNVSLGFYERYLSMRRALKRLNIKEIANCNLLYETDKQLSNLTYFTQKLLAMPKIPDVFVCGNDWTAIQLIHALNHVGYSVPKDVSVIGFDNIEASSNCLPPITTVDVPKEHLGYTAAKCLLTRFDAPQTPYSMTQLFTEIVFRESADIGDL